jgi:hypothetical protein
MFHDAEARSLMGQLRQVLGYTKGGKRQQEIKKERLWNERRDFKLFIHQPV